MADGQTRGLVVFKNRERQFGRTPHASSCRRTSRVHVIPERAHHGRRDQVHAQFPVILLPFITRSPDALTLILPLPSRVMSLPLMVMVPSFFIVMLASPVLSMMDSPAVMMSFLSTLSSSSLAMVVVRAPTTFLDS